MRFLQPGRFRFLLAFLVLLCHTCRFDLGMCAVYLFFVLSGYWIYRMWDEKYSRTANGIQKFYLSRFWRLFPVFWIANFLSCATAIVLHFPRSFPTTLLAWLHYAFSNLFILGYAALPKRETFLDPPWSLDIEIRFYLVSIFLFYLLRSKRERFATLSLIFAAVLGFLSFLLTKHPDNHFYYFGIYFLVGILAAKCRWTPSTPIARGIALTALAIVILAFAFPALRFLVQNDRHGATASQLYSKQVFQAVFALLAAPIALFSTSVSSDILDRKIGDVTYYLYLIQWPVMAGFFYRFGNLPVLRRLPFVPVAWILVWLICLVSFRVLDGATPRQKSSVIVPQPENSLL